MIHHHYSVFYISWSCQPEVSDISCFLTILARQSPYKRFGIPGIVLNAQRSKFWFVLHSVLTVGMKSRHGILSVVLLVNGKGIKKSAELVGLLTGLGLREW